MAFGTRTPSPNWRRTQIIGFLILVVLLILASIKSASPSMTSDISQTAWVDKTVGIIVASNQEGATLKGLLSSKVFLSSSYTTSVVEEDFNEVAAQAQSTYKQGEKLLPPSSLAPSWGFIQGCLLQRMNTTKAAAAAVVAAIGEGKPSAKAALSTSDPATQQLSAALSTASGGETLFRLFTNSLPSKFGPQVPPSEWTSVAQMGSASAAAYLRALREIGSSTPIHNVVVSAISTNPPALSTLHGIEQLPPTAYIKVQAVVDNIGNQSERDLLVRLSLTAGSGSSSAAEYVTLGPGSADTVVFPTLDITAAEPVTIKVLVSPTNSVVLPNPSRSLIVEVAASSTSS